MCPAPRAGRILQLNAGAAQPGLAGATIRADTGCQIASVAGDADGGMLAIEACGTAPEFLDGPARLLVMAGGSHQARRFTLGQCTDGNELATDQAATSTLVSAYLYRNPPGHPGPATRLWEYHDGTLRQVTSIPGDTSGASMMAWLS